MEKPSFGKSLEEHLNLSGREIAFPIEACVTMLLECGMQEEVEAALSFQQTPVLRGELVLKQVEKLRASGAV